MSVIDTDTTLAAATHVDGLAWSQDEDDTTVDPPDAGRSWSTVLQISAAAVTAGVAAIVAALTLWPDRPWAPASETWPAKPAVEAPLSAPPPPAPLAASGPAEHRVDPAPVAPPVAAPPERAPAPPVNATTPDGVFIAAIRNETGIPTGPDPAGLIAAAHDMCQYMQVERSTIPDAATALLTEWRAEGRGSAFTPGDSYSFVKIAVRVYCPQFSN
jgi:hypothetical protein